MRRNTDVVSDKQLEILAFIKSELLTKGYPPSIREICEAVKLSSPSSVHAHLNSLERLGYIRRDPAKSRTIEIVDDDFSIGRQEMISVPVIGRVAAGQPILAQENIESYFPYPASELPNGSQDLFMLEVHGDSMINAGILNGDRVIISQCSTARNGDIVVALVDDSATIKRFYKEDGHIRLQPENDSMDPIIVPDCKILGRLIALVRVY